MQIINSTTDDIQMIFDFYDDAIAYQKKVFDKHWIDFERSFIEQEVNEQRQFKLIVNGEVVCIFAITFDDEMIWGKRNDSPSVYLHRIVTRSGFRGNNYVKNIIDWAISYSKEKGKEFVRMDTWGDNQKLIGYYTGCGFKFLGLSHVFPNNVLPKHYRGVSLSLFEIAIGVDVQQVDPVI